LVCVTLLLVVALIPPSLLLYIALLVRARIAVTTMRLVVGPILILVLVLILVFSLLVARIL
jgi:hypothetical protein